MEQSMKKGWTAVQKTVAGIGLVFLMGLGLAMCDTNEAHAAPAPAAAPVEEPGFFARLSAKLPDNPFAMSQEDKLDIVREYNAETARQGQLLRAASAKAQVDARAAAEAKAKHELSLRALRTCVNAATNR